jgi:hypothetical protein
MNKPPPVSYILSRLLLQLKNRPRGAKRVPVVELPKAPMIIAAFSTCLRLSDSAGIHGCGAAALRGHAGNGVFSYTGKDMIL